MVRQKSLRVRFLGMVRDEHFGLQLILDRLGIKPEVLSRWFQQPRFRSDLNKAMKIADRRHRLEMGLNAHKAGERMDRIAAGRFDPKKPPRDVERLGCMNTVLTYALLKRHWFALDQATARARARQEPSDAPRDLAHPDIAHRAEEMLAEMEASRE